METITCPFCTRSSLVNMPNNACLYFHQCKHCNQDIKPLEGDCCVFCSYGQKTCPTANKP